MGEPEAQVTAQPFHCPACGRHLGELAGKVILRCKSCGASITAETVDSAHGIREMLFHVSLTAMKVPT